MECPICYEVIKNSCIGSCTHHFCYRCLINWCYQGGTECPICKYFIYEIRMDKEFDKINNSIQESRIDIKTNIINISFRDSLPPGITIMNNKGPGVKILNIKPKMKCDLMGLKKNDIILFLNDVPCIYHTESIKIIESSWKLKKELKIEILQTNK